MPVEDGIAPLSDADDVRLLAGPAPGGRWSSGLCDWHTDLITTLLALKLPYVLFAMTNRRAFPGSSGCAWFLTYTIVPFLAFVATFLALMIPIAVASTYTKDGEDVQAALEGLVALAAVVSGAVAVAVLVTVVVRRRAALRAKHGIDADGCGDVCAHLCCHPCALAQEARHVEFEEKRALAAAAAVLRATAAEPAPAMLAVAAEPALPAYGDKV